MRTSARLVKRLWLSPALGMLILIAAITPIPHEANMPKAAKKKARRIIKGSLSKLNIVPCARINPALLLAINVRVSST